LTIVGTDISEEALGEAREGWFTARTVEAVTERQFRRYFEEPGEDGRWRVRRQVRELVRFDRHNLMTPMNAAAFDCVFIRNVLIYFDRESKRTVIGNLIDALVPGGYLVVGPSEGVYDMLEPLERLAPFLYRRS
jgi:chemotaxis protein methyltransferase CheR